MKGKILRYSKTEKRGTIEENKNKTIYSFTYREFKALGEPKVGMRVEFSRRGLRAANIYKDISIDTNPPHEQKYTANFSSIDFGYKLEALLNKGMFNKFGVFVSIFTLICLMLPLIDINVFTGNENKNIALYNIWQGKISFVLLIASCMFFYGGINRYYLKFLNSIVIAFALMGYIDIYMEIEKINHIAKGALSPSIGFILGLVDLAVFAYLTYIHEPYMTNKSTF